MPLVSVRGRRVLAAIACSVILAGVVVRGVWWREITKGTSDLDNARAAYAQKDWTAAERMARALLRKNRQDPFALGLLARALYRQGATRPRQPSLKGCPRRPGEPKTFFCWVRLPFARIKFPSRSSTGERESSSTRSTLSYAWHSSRFYSAWEDCPKRNSKPRLSSPNLAARRSAN